MLALQFSNISVLDLSAAALKLAQQRLGPDAHRVRWLEADVTQANLAEHSVDVWHDRTVFHFLTTAQDRAAYVQQVLRAVKPGGHVIVATFAEDEPLQCSGLPVMRYSANGLHAEFGDGFELLHHEQEAHTTPFGTVQQFVYCYCRAPQSISKELEASKA